MAIITLITGGQRSGKSSYAQKIALQTSENPVYVATSRIWDELHGARIERHKKDRGEQWITIEEEKYLSKHDFSNKVVVVDCVTLWLNNFFYDTQNDIEASLQQASSEFDALVLQNAHFIFVTNELGMGGFPIDPVQAKFTDLQGWMNQYIASKANSLILMVSGVPLVVR